MRQPRPSISVLTSLIRLAFAWIVFTPADVTLVRSTYVAISRLRSSGARSSGWPDRRPGHHEDMPQFRRDEAETLLPTVVPYLEDIQRRKQAFDRNPSEPLAAEI